jgi:hypothetical protein
LFLFWSLVALSACAPAAVPEASSAEEPAEEEEKLSRTEFTSRIENFFEYDPLESGRTAQFLIHLTDLNDGMPVGQAEVTLLARRTGTEDTLAQTVARVGRVTGIYVAELMIPKPGAVDIEFRVKNPSLDEEMKLTGFDVR